MPQNNQLKVLVIGYVWPEPNSSAAGTRMLQLLQLFLAQNASIIFASPAKQGEHKLDLEALGIQEKTILVNDDSFDLFLNQFDPALVIFDRFMMEEQFGWRVAKHSPLAMRILNTEDLHSLRDTRQQLLKQAIHADKLGEQLHPNSLLEPHCIQKAMADSDLALREIAAIHRSDLTLMISDFETQFLQHSFQIPNSHLLTLPFLYPPIKVTPATPSFAERQHFIWIGNFRHAPNWDAVLTLKGLWPKIHQACPEAQCHIYGAYLLKKAMQLHNDAQGFLVKGWAQDSLSVIQQARVMLAPLRFGAGIKGKLAEAMMVGTPSITTPIGAEAMSDNIQCWNGAICQETSEFIEQAIALYQSPERWLKAQQTGYDLFNKNYTQTPLYSEALIEKIRTIQQAISAHRNSHFTGKMLNHHHHKSTQYMAQWIEAKNKNIPS